MKAAVLYAPGDLRYEDAPMPPPPGPGEVTVRVRAAGICGSDLDRVMRVGTYRFPCVPGHEFCGTVHAVGEGVDRGVGDRAAVAPILPCYRCESCQRGDFGLCDNYDYLGSRRDGGFAQYVNAPAKNLIPMPDAVDFIEGAAVEPAAVTLHGIKRVRVEAGDCVAVFGCGAIGLFAVQFARIMGAGTVIAVDVDETKLELARAAGAKIVLNGGTDDPVAGIAEYSDNRMADVCVETAGVPATQEQSARATRKGGRILFLGTAHRDVVFPPATFERVVRGELTAMGSWNSFSAPFPGGEWRAVLEYVEDGRLKIRPFISHVTRLADVAQTIRDMYERKYSFTKVIVRTPE
jgi:L-iditol 2-dehydrogenase